MSARKLMVDAGLIVMLGIVILAMGGPVSQAAGTSILVDDANPATDCGNYTNKTAVTDVAAAVTIANSGQTILICPGTQTMSAAARILGKKLTIKQAVVQPQGRPVIVVPDGAPGAFDVEGSTVTFDGLIIDASSSAGIPADYVGIYMLNSSGSIKNSTILGPNTTGSSGINIDGSALGFPLSVSVSNSYILGYQFEGIYADGPVKLTVTGSHLDATDGARVGGGPTGIVFSGNASSGVGPTGSVTKSKLLNNDTGVLILETSKVSVSTNTMINNGIGVQIFVSPGIAKHSADFNTITGNTILGIPSSGYGVYAGDFSSATYTISKLTVSKNLFVAARYNTPSVAIHLATDVMNDSAVTGSVSGNTFVGSLQFIDGVNGPFPGVKLNAGDIQP